MLGCIGSYRVYGVGLKALGVRFLLESVSLQDPDENLSSDKSVSTSTISDEDRLSTVITCVVPKIRGSSWYP